MDNIKNINRPNSYRLTGKYVQGYNIVALQITGDDGTTKLLKMDDIYKLVERNLIFGCKVVENEGTKHLLSTGVKIASLPLINNNTKEMKITGRVYKEGNIVGYTVTNEDGKVLNLTKDKVWDLARSKNIINAKAYMSNKKKIICGDGEYIRDLPIIKI